MLQGAGMQAGGGEDGQDAPSVVLSLQLVLRRTNKSTDNANIDLE